MAELSLAALGWSDFFENQVQGTAGSPMRVSAVHRDAVDAIAPDGQHRLAAPGGTSGITVGDWVLARDGAVARVLERQSLLARRAAGTDARRQLIAANVATLGIVTSCNADFNIARLERYLVLAADAGCLPLIVLTKADLAPDADDYLRQAKRISPLASVIAINARDPGDVARLAPWCQNGETLALLGSSGVGKTTIRNALTFDPAETQGVRKGDAKGRHTTTRRELVRTRAGGWLIDTPGMRALRLADASEGVAAVFSDIEALAAACKFSDCAHETEPGCAVRAALDAGELDPDRLARWRKLRDEEARNSETIAEARARARGFNRMVKSAMARKRTDRGEA